jgi:hypothetical protein
MGIALSDLHVRWGGLSAAGSDRAIHPTPALPLKGGGRETY